MMTGYNWGNTAIHKYKTQQTLIQITTQTYKTQHRYAKHNDKLWICKTQNKYMKHNTQSKTTGQTCKTQLHKQIKTQRRYLKILTDIRENTTRISGENTLHRQIFLSKNTTHTSSGGDWVPAQFTADQRYLWALLVTTSVVVCFSHHFKSPL